MKPGAAPRLVVAAWCAAFVLWPRGQAGALPPPAAVHKPVAQGQRGGARPVLGGPAKRRNAIGGPPPHG